MKPLTKWVLVIVGMGGGYFLLSGGPPAPPQISDLVVPELSAAARKGKALFQGSCAACHGADLTGTESGPPLLSLVYRPAMHADFAIRAAITNGVVPHHWRFGPMPPQAGIADEEISQLIAYIREMQRANGIE